MPLINTSLPNLIQGVSQQPDATRFSGQCDDQVNFMSSVVDGLTKRNGTRFVKKLFSTDAALSADSFIHFVNRSETERYVLIHDGTKFHAYNVLSGDEASIEVDGVVHTGGYTTANTYLDVSASTTNARDTLRATTVADGTFLINRSSTVSVDQTTRSSSLDKEALIFVKQGDYEKEYSLEVNYSSKTPATAQLTLTYTRDGAVYKLSSTSAVSVTGGGGSGYVSGDIYKVFSYPTTKSIGGVLYNVGLGAGTGDTTVKVTSDANGTISAASIEDIGRRVFFHKPGDARVSNVGATVSITVTLEESPGLGGVTQYDNTKHVTIYSEDSSKSYHADTTRITEVLQRGHHNTLTPHYSAGHIPTAFGGFEDRFSGIGAGTNAEFTLTREGNLIVLKRKLDSSNNEQSDFKIKAKDGLGGGALGVVYKEVGAITDLPLFAKNGFRVKVRGDGDLSADDYYVEFKTDDENQEIGPGSWVETVAPDILLNYKETSLPLFITNTGLNEFKLEHLKTAPRSVGDEISNPFASFSDQTIQNSVFFKNRLGFVCGSNIILSEAGLGRVNDKGIFEYNFGRTTVTTLLDSDPIDVIVESDRVTDITAAAASQENLILFSTNGQFVLKGEDLLTPKTVSVKPITNFEYNNETDPVSVGSYIYYPFDLGNHTGIREFSLNKTTDVYESTDITEQAPRYIPKDITYFSGSLSENLLGILSKDEDQSLYMYRYFFSENKKVLSSWFKWDFGVNIKGFEFIDSTLYIVATNDTAGETYILNMPLNFDGEDEGLATHTLNGSAVNTSLVTSSDDNVTHLDMRFPGMVYNNKITFPTFTGGATRPLRASMSGFPLTPTPPPAPFTVPTSFSVYTDRGVFVPTTTDSTGRITLSTAGFVPALTAVWVGFKFTSSYTFSEQVFKAQSGQARTPNASAKQFIKNLSLYHTQTSDYKIKVTPDKRAQYTNEFPASFTGTGSSLRTELKDGFFRAPVFTSSENVEIVLENDGAKPSNLQSAEFETFVHTRSNRYGA
ncbi:MAG: hypothetical protein CMI29_01635 [Opitutae bacterium]|nr:hypothetical protein [Opitutae bacterium]|tara:strand:- start:5945 stop:8986 length:3042 start_codon:yes stop_codon:yes gene_type:complete